MADDDLNESGEMMMNAMSYGTILPPTGSGLQEAIMLPSKFRKFAGGAVFSLATIAAWVIPYLIILIVFVILHIALPDNTPIFGDWVWVIGIPVVLSIPFRLFLESVTSFGELFAHITKYSFQSKWLWRASRNYKDKSKSIALINVISCHPSPSGGRAANDFETEPALVTLGMKPLGKFPIEKDPFNNDVIVDPFACADESHERFVLAQCGDKGDDVPDYVFTSIEEKREERYFDDVAFMEENKFHDAAVTPISDNELLDVALEEKHEKS